MQVIRRKVRELRAVQSAPGVCHPLRRFVRIGIVCRMVDLRLLITTLRELASRQSVPRGPTPSFLLGAAGGIAAKLNGGEVTGRAAAGYLFNTALVSSTISGSKTCVDLGCGTAVQLLQIARVNPGINFVGVDRESTMLQRAALHAENMNIRNVQWIEDDITAPKALVRLNCDAVIANMTLHDLSDFESAKKLASVIARLVLPGGAIYLEDFVRLKRIETMCFFAELNAPRPLDHFHKLFHASLQAAFTLEELESVRRELPATELFATYPLRFLAVIKSRDRGLSSESKARLRALYEALPSRYQADLTKLQRLFSLGGLGTRFFPFKR